MNDRARVYESLARAMASAEAGCDPEMLSTVFKLVTAYDVMHQRVAPPIAERGLSMAAFNLLSLLEVKPSGYAVNELTNLLLVTRQNVHAVVDGLEKRGLVRRDVGRDDRRVRTVVMTAEGAALLAVVLPEHLARIARILGGFTPAELDTLQGLLNRVRANAEQAQ
jgi:DNA-binding MarR family transcriptional regulator